MSSLIPPKASGFTARGSVAAVSKELKGAAVTAILSIPLSHIDPNPLQPRTQFDDASIDQLTESIRTYGLLEPIVVTPQGNRWQIVAGERRFRAFKKLRKETIPALVRSASELERLELALIENIQREDLNPMEKAAALAKLVDDFGLTQEQAAKKMGMARSTFANTIRLLSLPPDMQKGLADRKISEGHAKVLLGVADAAAQRTLYQQMLQQPGLSVQYLSNRASAHSSKSQRRATVDHELQSVAEQIESTLGTRVHIKRKSGGGFQIVIDTYSNEEFKDVVRKLQ